VNGSGKGKKWKKGKGQGQGQGGQKFTLPCRFWQEGKCLKGDECTYRHE